VASTHFGSYDTVFSVGDFSTVTSPFVAEFTTSLAVSSFLVVVVDSNGSSFVVFVVFCLVNPFAKEGSDSNSSDTSTDTTADTTTYSTDTSLTVKDGDTVNIDYVGSIDGVEFAGGNTNGGGADLTIGSGTYIDDFEEQLIGAHPGDTVEVNVTFPENYGNEELNGKDAVFTVTVNGIYED